MGGREIYKYFSCEYKIQSLFLNVCVTRKIKLFHFIFMLGKCYMIVIFALKLIYL